MPTKYTRRKIPQKALHELAPRERQILKMLLAEYSQVEICKTLNIHPNTVSTTKRNIMNKWNVNSIVGLVKEGIKRGYINLKDES